MNTSIFSPDFVTAKPRIDLPGKLIESPRAVINVADATPEALERGRRFADEIIARKVADFDKPGDKMTHVSTFAVIDGYIYMTYYANVNTTAEDPNNQLARLAYCPVDDTSKMTYLDIQSVGDTCSGLRVNLVYDTIFARASEDTLMLLWTAKVGDNYYRLYREFNLVTKTLGAVGVNRLKVGDVVNDFSASGIVSGLTENGIGIKRMYSDIGIMQKFTSLEEDGVTYWYTGAYSGDQTMLIRSTDFITWEFVSHPDFPNLSQWENATYVRDGKIYYFVRQLTETNYGFLTVYHPDTGEWESPVLIEDSQSRADFIEYGSELYMVHAPIDREHLGLIRIDCDDIAKSSIVLQADMRHSCFYPFMQYFGEGELALSYTVARQHIRLARFTLSDYLK